jgi:hypothetical protein
MIVLVVAAGCAAATGSPAADRPPETAAASPSTAAASVAERPPLPSGFPVPAGAVAVGLSDDDPGLIGRWESDAVGSAAYDFYVAELPKAGYRVVGLYPGGEVALIRFSVPDGEIWQVLALPAPDGRVTIEVRLDRP